jgi:hypothetical protein
MFLQAFSDAATRHDVSSPVKAQAVARLPQA